MNRTWEEKWIKEERIGKGGQGLTFVTKSKSDNNSKYAIKFLKEQKNPERRQRMFVEISALRILQHPNIPVLIDDNAEAYKENVDELYMVSSYISGLTLEKFLKLHSELDLQTALTICISLSETLEFCHKKGFIHRDIKPDNIILENDNPNQTKLIDFGLSFNQDIELEKEITPSWQHLGNRFLSLPELRVAEAYKRDFRSDITMLCGVLLFCLTGIHPTDLIDQNSAKPHRRKRSIEILSKISKNQLYALNQIFDIGFNLNINDRWQSIESLKKQLIKLKNMDPNEEKPSDLSSQLEQFKKRIEERKDYQQLNNIKTIFDNCFNILRNASREAMKSLKPTPFLIVQSNYNTDYQKQILKIQLGLKHSLNEQIFFYPEFVLYANGSEFVLEGNESEMRTELLRHSANEDFNWNQIKNEIVDYFLRGIISKEQ